MSGEDGGEESGKEQCLITIIIFYSNTSGVKIDESFSL